MKIWKKLFFLIFLLAGVVYFFAYERQKNRQDYPFFLNNPYLTKKMCNMMEPYLLPLAHPIKPQLDALFESSRVIADEKSLLEAGFHIITSATGSYAIIARHPSIPGYIFKLYLDTETRYKDGIPNWEWLTKRCIGAAKIRQVIREKKISHFTIPEKWLYILPTAPSTIQGLPIVLIATDMELEDTSITEQAWKTQITKKHLDELYAILKHGYGTIGCVRNIPYTKKGNFAFTDTEYPIRSLRLKHVLPYLSDDMQAYWAKLIHKRLPKEDSATSN